MSDLLTTVLYVGARYFHLLATMLVVGGTLFYLWVVPTAIAELKEPTGLAVFARARWIFRRIVFLSALTVLLSGAIITARSLWVYRGEHIPMLRLIAQANHVRPEVYAALDHPSLLERPTVWFALHVTLGTLALIIAVALVRGDKPPRSPLPWMRLNFVLLMLVVLLACLTRNARQVLFERVRVPNDAIKSAAQ